MTGRLLATLAYVRSFAAPAEAAGSALTAGQLLDIQRL